MKIGFISGFIAVTLLGCSAGSKYYAIDDTTLTSPTNTITTTNRSGGFFLVDYLNPETGELVYDFGLQDLSGRALIRKYGLIHPHDHIKQAVQNKLARKFGAKKVSSDKTISFHTDVDTLNSIPRTYNNVDLVLDVSTKGWALRFSEGAYYLELGAESRLFDVSTGRVLAYSECDPVNNVAIKASESQFLSNNAALLKEEIKRLSSKCAAQIYERMVTKNK